MSGLQSPFHFPVTRPAGRNRVSSDQREVGFGVIKFYLSPAFHQMAMLAPLFGKNFFEHSVGVGVAVGTTIGGKGETDSFFVAGADRDVAGNARDSEVSTYQGIIGFLVLGQLELRRGVSLHLMAFLAGPARRAAVEITTVVISVAVHTFFKLQPRERSSGPVASLAGQSGMFSQKGIAGLPAVVESVPVGQPPALCTVAALTGITEALAMGVLVAVRAELMRNIGKMEEFFVLSFGRRIHLRGVALGAGGGNVLAGQDKFCFAMIKSRCRLPAGHRVAGKTGRGKLAAVLVQMAARAVLIQPQKSFLPILFLIQKLFWVPDEAGLVTGLALQHGMFSLQRITGEDVVKFFLPFLEPDQLKVPPLMFHVAALAFPKTGSAVNSLSSLNARFESSMAGQAFVRRKAPIRVVASGAIFDPFQRGVALGQLSRGKLGVGPSEKKKKEHRSISASF
jgi:hypothetical protein